MAVTLKTQWVEMRRRCRKTGRKTDKYYFEKGIVVCDEWEDWSTFQKWALEHGWQQGLTLDRIDGNKDYCPENCRWITKRENALNKDHFNSMKALCTERGWSYSAVRAQLSRGWTLTEVEEFNDAKRENGLTGQMLSRQINGTSALRGGNENRT